MGAVVVDSGGALTLVLETTCVIGFATVDMFETVEVEVVDAPSDVSFSTSIDDAATGFMALPIAGAGAEIVGYVASVGGAEDDMVQENLMWLRGGRRWLFLCGFVKIRSCKKDGGNLSTYGIGTAFSAIATSLDRVSR